jgi:hypothetical protein
MISLCTVVNANIEKYFESIFLESIINKTEHITEVLIAKIDADPSFIEEWTVGSIKFTKFGCPTLEIVAIIDHGIQHALALHACIDRAKNDLVFISDPDLFFYNPIDKIYLTLMQEHDLHIIGCSHHHSINYANTFFPNQSSMLVNKKNLPDSKFLENKLKKRGYELDPPWVDEDSSFNGKYLIPGAIPEYAHLFPHKKGLFETSCNLWIVSQENNWKWLSFQTLDCHIYTTLYHKCYHNNGYVKIPKPKNLKLMYHINRGYTIARELAQIELHETINSGIMASKEYEQYKKEHELSKLEE